MREWIKLLTRNIWNNSKKGLSIKRKNQKFKQDAAIVHRLERLVANEQSRVQFPMAALFYRELFIIFSLKKHAFVASLVFQEIFVETLKVHLVVVPDNQQNYHKQQCPEK